MSISHSQGDVLKPSSKAVEESGPVDASSQNGDVEIPAGAAYDINFPAQYAGVLTRFAVRPMRDLIVDLTIGTSIKLSKVPIETLATGLIVRVSPGYEIRVYARNPTPAPVHVYLSPLGFVVRP